MCLDIRTPTLAAFSLARSLSVHSLCLCVWQVALWPRLHRADQATLCQRPEASAQRVVGCNGVGMTHNKGGFQGARYSVIIHSSKSNTSVHR